MITDHYVAADEMVDLFLAAVAGAFPIEWPNTKFTKPDATDTWARWSITHGAGGQATLAGATGRSRFNKGGAVHIEVFTPLGEGLKVAYDAAQIAVNAYEGKRTPSGVWFRNVRIDDNGQGRGGDSGWWCSVVVAEYEYQNIN